MAREHHRDGAPLEGRLENAKRRVEPGHDGLAYNPLESNETVVDSEVDGIHPSSDPKTGNLRPIKSSGYKAKSTAPLSTSRKLRQPAPNLTRSPRRRRTEKTAIKTLDRAVRLRPEERHQAVLRIRRSKQPNVEVKRVIAAVRSDRYQNTPLGEADFSDVQEVRAQLIRRDGGTWLPQAEMLRKLERTIATHGMTHREFHAEALRILELPQALDKKFLDRERAFQADCR